MKDTGDECEETEEVAMQAASLDIWKKKYRLLNKNGEPVDKDINATYQRVARALAEVEDEKDQEH